MSVDQLREEIRRLHDGERAEVRIGRAIAPRCLFLHRLRRYRWTVIHYKATDCADSGVYHHRLSMWTDSGNTFTGWGAAIAVGRAIRARAKRAEAGS